MRERGFTGFLTASFARLAEEMPALYAAMCRTLAPREVHLAVDDEMVALRFDPEVVVQLEGPSSPAIEVRTSRDAILDVIDARETLASAVLADRLWLRGAPDDLLAFHDGLLCYVHGAVRAPSLPALLRSWRDTPRLPEAQP